MESTLWVNVALAERCVRAVVGLVTIIYLLSSSTTPMLFALSYLASLYLLLTSLVAWDPLYGLFYKITRWLKIGVDGAAKVLPSGYQIAM